MMVYSFQVTDKNDNIFLMNHTVDNELESYVIELGATYYEPCVRLSSSFGDDKFYLESVIYDSKCAYNGMARGVQGTKSMVLTALCIAKHFYPDIKEYVIQDNSEIVDNNVVFNLHQFYLLTRGESWYQSFLKLKGDGQLRLLDKKLSKPVSITHKFEETYQIDPASIEPSNWYQFHTKLFQSFPKLKTNTMFRQIIIYHTSHDFASSLHGAQYSGFFQ